MGNEKNVSLKSTVKYYFISIRLAKFKSATIASVNKTETVGTLGHHWKIAFGK